jgi:hypothetical protein
MAFAAQLPPDLLRAVDLKVGSPDALDVLHQGLIASGTWAAQCRRALPSHTVSVARRGNLQHPADRLDPVDIAGTDRQTPASLQPAVELRLGEERAGQLQDFVGTAQFAHFAFEIVDALRLGAGHAVALAAVSLVLAHPAEQRLDRVPILAPFDSMAAHDEPCCPCAYATIRAARSRTSGET